MPNRFRKCPRRSSKKPKSKSSITTEVLESLNKTRMELTAKVRMENRGYISSSSSDDSKENGNSDSDEEIYDIESCHLQQQTNVIKCKSIRRKKLNAAIKLLRKPKLPIVMKNVDNLRRLCFYRTNQIQWNSPMYIVQTIRSCILNHDWDSIPKLLLLLMNHNTIYKCFINQVTLLNVLANPASSETLLAEFLQSCFVQLPANAQPDVFETVFETEEHS